MTIGVDGQHGETVNQAFGRFPGRPKTGDAQGFTTEARNSRRNGFSAAPIGLKEASPATRDLGGPIRHRWRAGDSQITVRIREQL
jgi:hypothetical protein